MRSASGGPPGSRTSITSERLLRRYSSSSRACVLFPLPSIPSKVMSNVDGLFGLCELTRRLRDSRHLRDKQRAIRDAGRRSLETSGGLLVRASPPPPERATNEGNKTLLHHISGPSIIRPDARPGAALIQCI